MCIDLRYYYWWWKINIEGYSAEEQKEKAIKNEDFERAAFFYYNFIS